jgi:hypothetical protein
VGGLKTARERISQVPQILGVDDLSMGLELRQSASLLRPGQSRLLRNWSLQEPGALVTLPGWETFSTTSLGNRRIQGGQRVYLESGTPFTLSADDGKVYQPSDGGVWGAAVLTGLNTSNQIYFPYDRTLVGVFDGDNIPKKSTDGTTWTQLGIDAPTVAPSASAVAGGTLVDGNTYEVSYAYQDDELGHVGNESATDTQATSTGNQTIRVAVTASADPQVDKIVLYVRDVTAGETVRRKYAEYANTTTNRDITAVTWTSGDQQAPSDHTVPVEELVSAVFWKNRAWAWVGNRLYFTQIFEPQSWPSLFYIDIPFEKGDDIAACVAQGDTLVVFGEASTPFVIIGQTSLDFEVRPALGAQAGAFGPRSVELIENGIVHAAAEGVYIFDGASDRLLSYNIDPGWQDMVQRSTDAVLHTMAVVYHGLRKELRIAVPRLYPWGTPGEWVLDLNRTRTQETPAWTSTDRTIGGYIAWHGHEHTTGARGRLFSWAISTAELCEESTGATADGSDLVCDAEGATHATGGYICNFDEGYLEFQPAPGTFSIEAFVDGSGKGSQAIDIGSSLATYGSAIYGTSVYGSAARLQEPFVLPLTCEGRTFAFRFRYTGQASFKLYTYKVRLVPEGALSGV